jgi:hypothetical protein
MVELSFSNGQWLMSERACYCPCAAHLVGERVPVLLGLLLVCTIAPWKLCGGILCGLAFVLRIMRVLCALVRVGLRDDADVDDDDQESCVIDDSAFA